VAFVGLLPDKSQVDQSAENERLQARLAEHGAEIDRLRLQIRESNAHYDRMRLEFTAAQQLRSEGERLQAEIERLGVELQQSEIRNTADAEAAEYAARLEMQLDNSREALRDLQEDHTAMDNRAEGARSAYLAVIKTLWEMRR
jgi:multidrug efflux pump subunit AcrA (membrane-fusion protein)